MVIKSVVLTPGLIKTLEIKRLVYDLSEILGKSRKITGDGTLRSIPGGAQVTAIINYEISDPRSAFNFASRKVSFIFYLHPKVHASSHFLQLSRRVCVRPGRKPLIFSRRDSNDSASEHSILLPELTG